MGYIALDIGANSGRAIIGSIKENKIKLKEVYRFDNGAIEQDKRLQWDFNNLLNHIKKGIQIAYQENSSIKGIGVDTWGVDYGLLDKEGELLQNPTCYRDRAMVGLSKKLEDTISAIDFYTITGIQQMDINSVYQLAHQVQNEPQLIEETKRLLFMPDLINYFLTGEVATEYTIASTSQLLNAKERNWEKSLFDSIGIPYSWITPVKQPGVKLGTLKKEICKELGIPQLPLFLIGSHDTASAISTLPTTNQGAAFLSSGTWSILGITSNKPILTQEALEANFTNEGGVAKQNLFMRNITGLWLFQSLREEWFKKENIKYSYDYLIEESEKAKEFCSIIDPDDQSFVYPDSMEKAIQDYCIKTNQSIPHSKGELVRTVLESLAIKYSRVKKQLESITQQTITTLHVVGGGSLNNQLNQFIANALNVKVITGVTEATALGNILQQAITNGELANWNEAYSLIENSFTMNTHTPTEIEKWENRVKESNTIY